MRAHVACLALASLVACDAILGLDDDYHVAQSGGSTADGGMGAGGSGGSGGEPACGDDCGACRACEDDTCVALAFDTVDDDCIGDDDRCDGLGTCAQFQHLEREGIQKVLAVAAHDPFIAVAGLFRETLTIGDQSITWADTDDDIFIALFDASGDLRHLKGIRVNTVSFETAITGLSVDKNGFVYMAGVMPGGGGVTSSIFVDGNPIASIGSRPVSYLMYWDPSMEEEFGIDVPDGEITDLDVNDNFVAVTGSWSSDTIKLCDSGDIDNADTSPIASPDAFVIVGDLSLNCTWYGSWGSPLEDIPKTVTMLNADEVIVGGDYRNGDVINFDGGHGIGGDQSASVDGFVVSLHVGPSPLAANWAWGFRGEGGIDIVSDTAADADDNVYALGAFEGASLSQINQAGGSPILEPNANGRHVFVAHLAPLTGSSMQQRSFPSDDQSTELRLGLEPQADGLAIGGVIAGPLTLGEDDIIGEGSNGHVIAVQLDTSLAPRWRRSHRVTPLTGLHRNLTVLPDSQGLGMLILAFSSASPVVPEASIPLNPDEDDIFLVGYRAPRVPRP